VLEANGVHGTFYIAGGLAGTQQDEWRLASPENVAEMHARGHEIGCHTYSHPVVQWLDADGFAAELDRNKDFLASLGIVAESFCYPYGIASLARKLQAQARYTSCRSTKPGINSGMIDLGMLRATPIDHASTEAALKRAIDETVRLNGWLVLFTHDVSPEPTWIGATPQFLDMAVKAALARGCEVVTVRDALKRIGATPPR
jgi:peptidoglycan/xylan/chitin deacetylase (PgdA/CDA1 family)